MFPMLWAQTGPDESALPILALQRWFQSLTLSAPDANSRPVGLWVSLAGMGALLLWAMVAQGPARCLGQLLDVPGHVRRLGVAVERLRRSGRLLVLVLGATVLSWTGYLFMRYNAPMGLENLLVLTRSKSAGQLAVGQGELASLTLARDVLGLGSMLVLLIPAGVQVFRAAAGRWGPGSEELGLDEKPMPAGVTVYWAALGLFALYRITEIVVSKGGLPLGECTILEAVVVPLLALISDGVIAAWVFAELAARGRAGEVEPPDPRRVLGGVPSSMVACLLALPARYVGLFSILLLNHSMPARLDGFLTGLLRGWGLVYLQGASLPMMGVVAALAMGGPLRGAVGRSWRLMGREGGHLVAWVAMCGVGAGLATWCAYALLLSLPAQPWVLPTADAYAHYVSLPFGLVLVSGLIGLAEAGEERGTKGELESVGAGASMGS